MKKTLLVTASFFVLGALLIPPLYAMNEDHFFASDLQKSKNPKKRKHLFDSDLEQSTQPQPKKICSISRVDLDILDGLEVIKNARLNSLVHKTENKYSIVDYRQARNSYLDLAKKCSNEDIFKDGAASCAHQVTDFKDEVTVEDWRIARDAYTDIGHYEVVHYFVTNFPTNNSLELEDRRAARFICLQTQAFVRAYEHSQKVIEELQGEAAFEDYYPLILSEIGCHGYNDLDSRERVNNHVNTLETKLGQDLQVKFFISFLKETEEYRDFSPALVDQAKNMNTEDTSPFTQALKIFVLEEFPEEEDVENLEIKFCEKYSRKRLDSELRLIKTIYASLENGSDEEEDSSSNEMRI